MPIYDAVSDPYCYPGTTVLKNIADLRTQPELDRFETVMTAQRTDEPLPPGRLSVVQYRAIHHHLFQDVYVWAGRFRTVRMGKDGSAFCYPEHIDQEMRTLFSKLRKERFLSNRTPEDFARSAAEFLSTLNAIHPFREGNGRTQMTFLALLADRAGHSLNLERLAPQAFLGAMVQSFRGDNAPLERRIAELISMS